MQQKYFIELSRRLAGVGIDSRETSPTCLSVLLGSHPSLTVDPTGNVSLLREWSESMEANDLFHRTDALAGEVYEYVHAVETAPRLSAGGFANKLCSLADFGGAVLMGWEQEDGQVYQFATWIWERSRTEANHVHRYGNDFRNAKQDFAVRSGLISKAQLFTPEEMTELYRATDVLLEMSPQDEQLKALQNARLKIAYTIPDLAERLERGQETEQQMNM
ncbi:hypothetical protein DWV16_00450 [Anaerotruncus sp. AF02-27]|uniref:hypothetical protein n=1 Tax=Anaerotruncus sp. AF02-27 TaxID=2292191 RepID=UPI000E4C6293|nr:hypothetical protein [Anaerotruncus sp. AF02-27]RGX56826.1 hypothetical protein DWV16_00450 [Anaerotruncus sp. AF02-27]